MTELQSAKVRSAKASSGFHLSYRTLIGA